MNFSPSPWWAMGLGLLSFGLTIFGGVILVLFARSLLVGEPGLGTADMIVALAAAVILPLVGGAGQWLTMRRLRRTHFGPAGMEMRGLSEPLERPREWDRFDKFDERARRVLVLAQDEAQRFNHSYIGTEHILLGLMRDTDGVAARVLANLGVEVSTVRTAVEFIIGKGPQAVEGEVGLTTPAKRVIELAVEEARTLGHGYIGTEHLLLGLVRERDGIAAGVLESLGVSLDRTRTEVLNELGGSSS